MNWEAIGAIGEIIGASAVLTTLIAIYFQQRKIQTLAKADNQREVLRDVNALFDFIATHPSALESVRRCLHDFDNACPREQADFSKYAHLSINIAEQGLLLFKDNLINETVYVGLENVALTLLVTPGGKQWWSRIGAGYGAHIRHQLETALQTQGSDILPTWEYLPYFSLDHKQQRESVAKI